MRHRRPIELATDLNPRHQKSSVAQTSDAVWNEYAESAFDKSNFGPGRRAFSVSVEAAHAMRCRPLLRRCSIRKLGNRKASKRGTGLCAGQLLNRTRGGNHV